MLKRRRASLLKFAFAALMLWLQAASLAHASAFEGPDHTHDGVVCQLQIIADDELLLPAVNTPIPLIFQADPATPTYTPNVIWHRPQGRAPPPRGPPTSTQ